MRQVLFQITIAGRELPVYSYTVFVLAGLLVFYLCSRKAAVRQGITSRQYHTAVAAMLLLMVAGERLTHWLNHPEYYRDNWLRLFDPDGGLVLYGGLIVAFAGGYLLCRWMRIDYWRLMDALAPGIGLGMGVAYIGCLLNGCCFGQPTTLPWAVVFPAESIPGIYFTDQYRSEFGDTIFSFYEPLSLHPTQIYKSIAALTGGLLALYLLARKAKPGVPFLSMLLVYYTLRAFIAHLQVVTIQDETMVMLLPYILAGTIVLLTALLWWRIRRPA